MTTSTVDGEIGVEDRQGTGELARERTPLSSQADWDPGAGRPDPVELLIEQNPDPGARFGTGEARPG